MIDFEQKLSATELDVVRLIESGMKTKEIASKYECSSRTVEKHRSNIIKKLNLTKGTNLEYWLIKRQLKRQ